MTPYDAALFLIDVARPRAGHPHRERVARKLANRAGQRDDYRAELLAEAARAVRDSPEQLRTYQRAREALLHPPTSGFGPSTEAPKAAHHQQGA